MKFLFGTDAMERWNFDRTTEPRAPPCFWLTAGNLAVPAFFIFSFAVGAVFFVPILWVMILSSLSLLLSLFVLVYTTQSQAEYSYIENSQGQADSYAFDKQLQAAQDPTTFNRSNLVETIKKNQ
jgi:hypothetical protein